MLKNNYKIVQIKEHQNKIELSEQIASVIKEAWGDFGEEYVNDNILNAKYIFVAFKNKEIVGFNTVKEFDYEGEKIYYFEFSAVKPLHQGKNLSIVLTREIIKKILIQNIKKFKF